MIALNLGNALRLCILLTRRTIQLSTFQVTVLTSRFVTAVGITTCCIPLEFPRHSIWCAIKRKVTQMLSFGICWRFIASSCNVNDGAINFYQFYSVNSFDSGLPVRHSMPVIIQRATPAAHISRYRHRFWLKPQHPCAGNAAEQDRRLAQQQQYSDILPRLTNQKATVSFAWAEGDISHHDRRF